MASSAHLYRGEVSLRKELAKVSQKLKSKLAYTWEEFSVMEHNEKQLRSELEATKMYYAKSVAYTAEQEEEFRTKMSEVELANEGTEKELEETKALS